MTDRFDELADRLAERVVAAVEQLLDQRDARPVPLLTAKEAAGRAEKVEGPRREESTG